jgi:hypothetical protein
VIDFVNRKIKPAHSFGCAHRVRVCMCVHRGECSYVYEYMHLYCVSNFFLVKLHLLSICVYKNP